MIICLIFVVGALFEFAIVVLISRSSKSSNIKLDESLKSPNTEIEILNMAAGNSRSSWIEGDNNETETDPERNIGTFTKLALKWFAYMARHINTIDLVAFCVYLFLFLLFNCIYWAVYLKKEALYDLVD